MEQIYPNGPEGVPADLARPSSAYRRHAWFAVASLLLFLLLYLVLAGWFIWTSYRMFHEISMGGQNTLVHFIVGGCAAFLALFMLKGLFFFSRNDTADELEVTAENQPRLFEFLHRLADEAGAPRPKRVFLSARVNAAVFYDFSVLNLIFPSKKNLEIGLALVNVLTLSELKAVLAHEFGHFAQRSMAIGSWVYIAQRIATQIVDKRDALDKLLQGLSRFDIRVAWIGWLLSLIVWSIRSLMDTLLRLVVLAQRALSREMEFQADLVSVSLTGSDELVNALHKLQAADEAWDRGLRFAESELQQKRIPHDLFAVQTRIIEKMAKILDDEDYGKVPRSESDDGEKFRVFQTSFAHPPQMWATHPANADREENAKRRYLTAPHDERSAWLLLDNVEGVKKDVTGLLLGQLEGQPSTAEQTLAQLDERYDLLQYNTRYRGAYLGRPLTRHVETAGELYRKALKDGDVQQALASLYPHELSGALTHLRELEEERLNLEALHERIYKPTDGRIVFRGKEISRRELPDTISKVREEEEKIRQRILAHDQRCRAAHLSAAEKLGYSWRNYLVGLIELLHYSEHTLADLQDAHGLLGNVIAVVMADRRVTSSELKRVIATANGLHAVLARIYEARSTLQLDEKLCEQLNVKGWEELLEEFKLPPADEGNINDWMEVIDGWVGATAGALSGLYGAALEQLLITEDMIEQHLQQNSKPDAAPAPSAVPSGYPAFLAGQERKRQKKLGLWDRFQTADGTLGTVSRLLVAGAFVGAVLGFGSFVGTQATLSIYNGLGTVVQVDVGEQQLTLRPFSSREIEIDAAWKGELESRGPGDQLIERFDPPLDGIARHYVYNVAGASPLVEWTASYGSAAERPSVLLGTQRWLRSSADYVLQEPPESIETSSSGGTRTVLSAAGDRSPEDILSIVEDEAERIRLIKLHATWDQGDSDNPKRWRELAESL
jgi:Zn-dependent protease with chaperone function